MLANMDLMLGLPEDIKIFVGHEYARKNFQFCLKAEGELNDKIAAYWEMYKARADKGEYIVPSILRDEK